MKLIRVYTGDDGESHLEERRFAFTERDGLLTRMHGSSGVLFRTTRDGSFLDFHPAPRRQYVLYLTGGVEIGVGSGETVTMEPGDVLLAEDVTGRGHTSRVGPGMGGLSAFVALDPGDLPVTAP